MKLIKLSIVGLLAFGLMACESTEPQSASCKSELKEGSQTEIKIDAKGKKIVKQTIIETIDLSAHAATPEVIEKFKANLDEIGAKLETVKGVKREYNINEANVLTATTEMDFEKGTVKDFMENKLIQTNADDAESFDFDKTVEAYKKSKYTCK